MRYFVCAQNRCRSPVAEFFYRELTGREAGSFGVSAKGGEELSWLAVETLVQTGAAKERVDEFAKGFRSRGPAGVSIHEGDELVALDNDVESRLKLLFPNASIKLIRPGGVQDPVIHVLTGRPFKKAALEIKEAIKAML